jgi:putative hemolysin
MDDGYSYLWIVFGAVACFGAALYLVFRYWKSRQESVTEEDIKTMVNEGHEQGVLETREAKMISNIFELDEKEAGDIMTHRKHIVALPGDMALKEAARFMLQEGNNTRYPVYKEDMDDIIGTIHMRDVLVHAQNPREGEMELANVPGVLREAHFIPETRNLDSLFKEMQSQKIHMEIVIDEYGQTAGLVTMEDILEEIVGNILDEYDVEEKFIVRQENGDLIMNGMTPLREAKEALEIEFPEEDLDNYDTVNGLLISRLDRILQEGERPEVVYQGVRFSVLKVENKMIQSVRAEKLKGPSESGDDRQKELLNNDLEEK